MAGEQGTLNADVGTFLDQLLKPTMQGQAQPQMRAMPVAPGTMQGQQGSPVQQGAQAPARATVQQAQRQSLPLPPQYVQPPAAPVDELNTVGGQSGGIPYMQILTAALGAGGAGALIDALSRGGVPGSAEGARSFPSAPTGVAPDAAMQGEVIPPTQQRIPGTNPEPPTIDGRVSPSGELSAPPARPQGQTRIDGSPVAQGQLDEVLRPGISQTAQPRLTEAPALPSGAITLPDDNNKRASLPSQTQQGGMPQGAGDAQAKIGKVEADASTAPSNGAAAHEAKAGKAKETIDKVLSDRGIPFEDLPKTAQKRLTDPKFLAQAESSPSFMEDFVRYLKTLKGVVRK